uniref:F-box protein AT5G49610-like beta-propeller domain-containing protein n=1 Tax=Setaria viridis TaxID=4556 RepID=A0A4U6VR88_SETVI|nr:hypothetical protein SEVIR_2G028000v2 [Setaria viridis]
MAPPRPPPALIDDVTTEILIRLPPDEPEHLFRAALVCKPWLRVLCDPAFLHRYPAFHGAPSPRRAPRAPLRLHHVDARLPHPGSDGRRTRPLDCGHGRVLIHMLEDRAVDLLVWDPVTGDLHGLREPHIHWMAYSAAVFCVADGCDHLDCHGGPFRVVFIWASVYSSETGAWSTPTSVRNGGAVYVQPRRGTIVGDEIYFTLSRSTAIVKYDWDKNCLSVIDPPPPDPEAYCGLLALMQMKDSSLGLAGIEDSRLHIWSMKVNAEGAAEWLRCRIIDLEKIMPMAKPCDGDVAYVVGYAEGVGVIFVSTDVGLFTIELKFERVRKVDEPGVYYSVLPYMSFYTPGMLHMFG